MRENTQAAEQARAEPPRREASGGETATSEAGPMVSNSGHAALFRSLNRSAAPVSQGAGPLLPEVGAKVEAAIAGPGAPLPETIRTPLEESTGYDLGVLRVHTDSKANEAAEATQALAFNTGTDMCFRQGMFDLSSNAGVARVAEEAYHAIQTAEGRGGTPGMVSHPSDPHEVEASSFARDFASSYFS